MAEILILCTSVSIENESEVPLMDKESCSLDLVEVMLWVSVLTIAPVPEME